MYQPQEMQQIQSMKKIAISDKFSRLYMRYEIMNTLVISWKMVEKSYVLTPKMISKLRI